MVLVLHFMMSQLKVGIQFNEINTNHAYVKSPVKYAKIIELSLNGKNRNHQLVFPLNYCLT